MPDLTLDGITYTFDEKGYLVDFGSWTPELAAAIAAEDGIAELGEDHWRVIAFLREHQLRRGVAPMVRVLCRETGHTLQQIYALFPKGPTKGACRVAGLPRPDSCV
jgi:TusE/DsrC/DsvC family sulfur relay protein